MAKNNFKYDDIITSDLKRDIINDYVNGLLTIKDIKNKYNIRSNSYIGKIFGSDLCIYYLGKNDKGQPFIIVECQLCGILREVNAYNIGLRTMKKCDCVSQRPSLSKKKRELFTICK